MKSIEIKSIITAFVIFVIHIFTNLSKMLYNIMITDLFKSIEPGNILYYGDDLIDIISLVVLFGFIVWLYSDDEKIQILYQNRIKVRISFLFFVIPVILSMIIVVFADFWIKIAHSDPSEFIRRLLVTIVLETGDSELVIRVFSGFDEPYQLKFYRFVNILFNQISPMLFHVFGMITIFMWQKITYSGSGETYPTYSTNLE